MLQMVEDLESTPFSIGRNSTQIWLRDFLNYRQFFDNSDETFYDTLQQFLKISFNSHWNSYIKWESSEKDVWYFEYYKVLKLLFSPFSFQYLKFVLWETYIFTAIKTVC